MRAEERVSRGSYAEPRSRPSTRVYYNRASRGCRRGADCRTIRGAGLTVIRDALPVNGRIVLVEPSADPAAINDLPDPPPSPPRPPS